MTHVPGGVPGPNDEPDRGQNPSPWSQPAHPGQPPSPRAGNYPGAGQPPSPQVGNYPGAGQPGAGHPGGWQTGTDQPSHAPWATSTGLQPPIAGLVAYAFGWMSGVITLLVEKKDQGVRFHAAQSIAVFGPLSVLGIVTSTVSLLPVIGWLLVLAWIVLGPLTLFLWIFLMVRAYQETEVRLPLAANVADRILGVFR